MYTACVYGALLDRLPIEGSAIPESEPHAIRFIRVDPEVMVARKEDGKGFVGFEGLNIVAHLCVVQWPNHGRLEHKGFCVGISSIQ